VGNTTKKVHSVRELKNYIEQVNQDCKVAKCKPHVYTISAARDDIFKDNRFMSQLDVLAELNRKEELEAEVVKLRAMDYNAEHAAWFDYTKYLHKHIDPARKADGLPPLTLDDAYRCVAILKEFNSGWAEHSIDKEKK